MPAVAVHSRMATPWRVARREFRRRAGRAVRSCCFSALWGWRQRDDALPRGWNPPLAPVADGILRQFQRLRGFAAAAVSLYQVVVGHSAAILLTVVRSCQRARVKIFCSECLTRLSRA